MSNTPPERESTQQASDNTNRNDKKTPLESSSSDLTRQTSSTASTSSVGKKRESTKKASVGSERKHATFLSPSGDFPTPRQTGPTSSSTVPLRTSNVRVSYKKSQESLPQGESQIDANETEVYRFLKTYGGESESTANVHKAEVFIYITIPLDGGYAWVVLLMSFLSQVVVDGIILSMGVLLPVIGHDLALGGIQTALVSATELGMYFLTGPIASACVHRHGFRPVAITGALLASCIIACASFSNGVEMLILLYGMAGGSLGIVWICSQLIIGYYFEKRRPIAAGISCSGAGAGVLIFSRLNTYLTRELGWRNTVRVHVGFIVLVAAISCFYIEVEPTKVGRIIEYADDSDTDSIDSSELASTRYSAYVTPMTNIIRTSIIPDHAQSANIGQRLVEIPSTTTTRRCDCFENVIGWTCSSCCRRKATSSAAPPPIRESLASIPSKRYIIQQNPLDRNDIFYTGTADYSESTTDTSQLLAGKNVEIVPGKEQKARSINYTISMMRAAIPDDEQQPILKKKAPLHLRVLGKVFNPKIREALRILFDVKLLHMGEFRLLLISAFFFLMGVNIPFLYSALRADIADSYAILVAPIIGLTNFILRIFSGIVTNAFKMNVAYFCGGGMFLGGFVTMMSGFFGRDIVWFQFMVGFCFAIAPAFFSSMRAILYVKVLGLEKLTNAFGLVAMAMGLGAFIGISFAGVLNERTGGFQASFVFSGFCMTVAGLIKLILTKYMEWHQKPSRIERKVRFSTL